MAPARHGRARSFSLAVINDCTLREPAGWARVVILGSLSSSSRPPRQCALPGRRKRSGFADPLTRQPLTWDSGAGENDGQD